MIGGSKTALRPVAIAGAVAVVVVAVVLFLTVKKPPAPTLRSDVESLDYQPRKEIDTAGLGGVFGSIEPWGPDAPMEEYAAKYERAVPQGLARLEQHLRTGAHGVVEVLLAKASLYHASGHPEKAYETLEDLEDRIRGTDLEAENLYTIIYYKGLTGLRIGENDNCILCRGDSACIFPIDPAAVHTRPRGSRLAVKHFTEYLRQFPDDLEVKWLLNLAHMTLGEYPDKVDPRYRLVFDSWCKPDVGVRPFRDVGHLVGVNRLNQSGGAIMDDFDNDGLLDIVVTSWAPNEPMAFYRNKGDGTFEDRTKAAGLENQMGGLYCVQADYNNDGNLDVFVPRGSWMPDYLAQRPSLLRNNGDGTFTDVTRQAGLSLPVNSISGTWADFDNDGFLDLFVCCQRQPCLLYRNKGDGTFEEVRARAGLPADLGVVLGAAWLDYDNDGYPDLFINCSGAVLGGVVKAGAPRLFHNNRDGTFTEVTREMGIDGPPANFSCWAFDFDNDGWIDIFTVAGGQSVADVVKGMLNQPSDGVKSRLYRNLGGKKFQDVAPEVGLDQCCTPMGSNFGDFDNDGYLGFYLGTGTPSLSALIPNRLFKNVAGRRFVEVTGPSRTGHLQKGHAVAFGDWDRNGTLDLFIELGGAVKGDSYHNVLFQNPGNGNNWLNVKLVGAQTPDGKGKKTNRSAIGARIKVVTAGDQPLTVHRHVSSGSSFGANPLEQHIGLGKADRVALLEVQWPTSGTTQAFRDIAVNQGVVITEFATDYQTRSWKPIPLPPE
jgi:hypothetical protein